MSLWKLLLNVMLMLVLAVTLTACGGDDDDSSNDDDDDTTNDDDDDDDTVICQAALAEDCVGEEEFNEETCLCECNLTCGAGEVLDEEGCVCVPEGDDDDCGDPLDGESLVGSTAAIVCLLDPTFVIEEPAGIGPILMGLVSCEDIPPIAFTVADYDAANNQLQFVGADLNPDMTLSPDATILTVPPASFDANPCFEIQVDGAITLEVEGLSLTIFDLFLGGEILPAGGFEDGVMAGVIDPAPLADLLGDDPCNILPGICNEEGLIPLRITNMSAVDVPGVVIPMPE